MKKLSFILFIAFYSLTATGFSMNLHYCLGELSEIAFFGHQDGCCCGGEETMADCCDDETLQLSSSDQQLLTNSSFTFDTSFIKYTSITKGFEVIEITSPFNRFISEKLPPPKHRPIWLVNCNLTYYG